MDEGRGMTFILIGIGLLLILVEILTVSTIFIWISIGFFAAALASAFTGNLYVLILVGTIATVLSLVSLKSKYVNYTKPKTLIQTASNELIGKKAKMLESYRSDGASVGVAIIGGVTWTVSCEREGLNFKEDELVKISAISGSRLIIEKGE